MRVMLVAGFTQVRAMSRLVKICISSRTAAGAVEFALVAPLFMIFLFATIFFSALFTVTNGVQQLAAESARAALAGLSGAERDQIAKAFIQANAAAYPLLDARKLSVSTADSAVPPQFQVSLVYDLSGLAVFRISSLISPALTQVKRSAVVGTS